MGVVDEFVARAKEKAAEDEARRAALRRRYQAEFRKPAKRHGGTAELAPRTSLIHSPADRARVDREFAGWRRRHE